MLKCFLFVNAHSRVQVLHVNNFLPWMLNCVSRSSQLHQLQPRAWQNTWSMSNRLAADTTTVRQKGQRTTRQGLERHGAEGGFQGLPTASNGASTGVSTVPKAGESLRCGLCRFSAPKVGTPPLIYRSSVSALFLSKTFPFQNVTFSTSPMENPSPTVNPMEALRDGL